MSSVAQPKPPRTSGSEAAGAADQADQVAQPTNSDATVEAKRSSKPKLVSADPDAAETLEGVTKKAPKSTLAKEKASQQKPDKEKASKPKPGQKKAKKANPAEEGQPEPSLLAAPVALPAGGGREVAARLRRERAKRLVLRLLLFVCVPTVLAAIYFGTIASNQFESYSVFKVHSAEARPTMALEGLLGAIPGAGTAQDALVVREYVLSRDMLKRLDEDHGFIAHYKLETIDWWSRLAADASFEDAYQYFSDKVYADYDSTSGTLTLRVRAFTPDKAQSFTQAILQYSEQRVNELSDRERRDRTSYAEKEVELTEKRLAKARQAVLELQRERGEFNPQQSAAAAMALRTHLESEMAAARARLMELKSYMNPDAPQVRAAAERVRSLSAQVAGENRRLVDPKKEGGFSSSIADFEAAMVEKEFAERAYESARTALELARADASRQHRYVASIALPSLPDESTYPRRWLGVLTVFILSFLLLGIVLLLAASVREHAKL